MRKSKLMVMGMVTFMLTACGSSDDIDAVAAGLMTGSDPATEKDAKCMAKSMKKNVSDDQWDTLVKINTGEIDEQDLSLDEVLALAAPAFAAAVDCGVDPFGK